MGILRVLLIVVEVFTSVLLIGVILLQKSKGEGLGLAFGAGVGESLFGSRAGNVLTRATITLAAVFVLNTAFLGVLFTRAHETSIIDQRTAPLQAMPSQQQAPQEAPLMDAPVEAPPAAEAAPAMP